ncbi:uncharacterized protein EV154DRAFT_38834 [Mucor mucedo]|uniref:uncharacterized protein n=1 Tax=Mucor mucedo TaxID=29922 RepID=UPI00221E41D7|nr:uncharacterized protein EV154DRAFT_38834 [Mucor mucedo]KAI7895265.1 hypothetical protein EV154DRAFT_38834 [Mucor mucedo]
MNNHDNITDADMEAEFIERNNNLKRSWNNIIDKIDNVARSTHSYLEAPELRADINSTSTESGHLGAFKASGNPGNYSDTTSTSGMMNGRVNRTGFYDEDSGLNSGRHSTGFYDGRINSAISNSRSRSGYDSTQATDNLETRRTPSNVLVEQSSRHSGGLTSMDRKLMNSVQSDIHAMHSTDPEEFEGVASKIDETFGNTALM